MRRKPLTIKPKPRVGLGPIFEQPFWDWFWTLIATAGIVGFMVWCAHVGGQPGV